MKRIWAVVVAAVLALWCGYSLGHRRGMQEEQAAWLAAEQVEFDSKDGQLIAVYQALVPTPAGPRKFVQRFKHPTRMVYFADPHTGGVKLTALRAQNTPDPRNMPVK
jgi:hypothetical protein